ncbi:hypothetical protein EI94DRAFT_1704372 [Lactarius quietus]|nr:hypothetical protein EI94DRAFT_1704372 [Lactarius quietus]
MNCVTRSASRASTATPMEGKSQSPSTKKGKLATAEDAQAMPAALFNIFKRILERYNTSILADLYETLQVYALLLQENANGEQITKKAIDAIAQWVEDRMEASVEKSLRKMSTVVESLIANQKELQGLTTTVTF